MHEAIKVIKLKLFFMKALNTLYELLHNSIEEFSDKIAFSMFGGEDVTYAEIGKRVEQVQEMLLGAGLNAGDKVAITGFGRLLDQKQVNIVE